MGIVRHIWRHPVKSHGREELEKVLLSVGRTMPWDRTWAVAHSESAADNTNWVHCSNFSRGAKAPSLMAINAKLDEETQTITLTHPNRPTLTFRPDTETAKLLDWVAPLMPENRAQSARILRVPDRGMTDTEFPSISLNSLASNRAVGAKTDDELSPLRWRGNIWFDGVPAWDEFNWIGKTIRVGQAEILVRERITRCLATTANPVNGARDVDTLKTLQDNWGHQDFGVYGEVQKTGKIEIGDPVEVVS